MPLLSATIPHILLACTAAIKSFSLPELHQFDALP
jgi:hypothetical protein